MKKFYLLLFFFGILAWSANAQVTILNESFESGSIPTGWTVIDQDNDNNDWFVNSSSHTGTYGISSESFIVNTYQDLTPDNWLITPLLTISGNTTLTFFVKSASDFYDEHYGVFIDTTGSTNPANFFSVMSETMPYGGQWIAKTVDLSNYSGNIRIAFRHFQCTGLEMLSLDDIVVTTTPTTPILTSNLPSISFGNISIGESIVRPIMITGTNLLSSISATVSAPFTVSSNGVTFSSQATLNNSGTLYIRYEPTAVGSYTGTLTVTSTNASALTIPLNGDANDCTTETLPLYESFEGSTIPPTCWTILYGEGATTNTVNPVTHSNEVYTSGNHSFRFSSYNATNNYNEYLITPALPNNLPKTLSFDYRGSERAETFRIGYSTSTQDLGAFVWENDIVWSLAEGWVSYFNAAIPANAKYIAIHYKSTHQAYLYIDNLTIDELPACPSPHNLNITNVTGTSATVQWTVNPLSDGSETYYVSYRTEGSSAWTTVNTTNTSVTLTNLQERTNYNIRMYAICANGISDTTTRNFQTNCMVGGDAEIGSPTSTSTQFPCYTNFNYSFSQQLFLSSELGVERDLRSISFQMTSNEGIDRNLSIYLKATNQNTLTDWISASGAQLVYSGTVHFLANSAWTTITFSMPYHYDGTSNLVLMVDDNSNAYSYRQFRSESSTNMSRYAYSDNNNPNPLTISSFTGSSVAGTQRNYVLFGGDCGTMIDPCLTPTLYVNNISHNSATVQWVENGSASAWQLCYGPSNITPEQGTLINLTTTQYTITDLVGNSTYRVFVRAICDNGNYSDWTDTFFSTEEEPSCSKPLYLQTGNNTATSTTFSWVQEAGTATNWTLFYRPIETTDWTSVNISSNPYILQGLTPESTYEAHLVANCNNGLTSDPTDNVTFTTNPDGINDYLVAETKLYPNPNNGEFTINNAHFTTMDIQIYDVYGRQLRNLHIDGDSAQLNLSELADGMYIVRIQSDKGSLNKTFIKK